MFLNPIMLAGLGGAALPVVLHLLARARYRTVDWGAMMFLEPRTLRQQHASRLKQLLLLLMRMLIVALLAMALARPVVQAAGFGEQRSALAIILLDNSPSMSYERNGVTRLDQARRAALAIVTGLRRGDQVALMPLGDVGAEGLAPDADLQAAASRIADMRIGAAPADMAAALLEARRILQREPRLDGRIFIITDRQHNSWRNVSEAFAEAWNTPSEGVPPVSPALILVGDEESENLAIESIRLLNPPAIENATTEIEVRVGNFGQGEQVGVPLVITQGRTELSRMLLTLQAQSSQAVRASVRLPRSGSQIVAARLEQSGGMTLDNVAELAVEAQPPLNVLIVSGDERARPEEAHLFRNESDFLRLALAPFATSRLKGTDPTVVSVVAVDEFNGVDRAQFPVVVLANVPRLSAQQVRLLEQYVYGGGGLLIAPGNLARVEEYNSRLYRDGAGLLPARLGPPASAAASGTTLLGLQVTHPVFQFLQGRPDPVPTAAVARYLPAQVSADASVLARYRTGDPFLIERGFGRGRVLLMTTPLDADWSTLPLSNFYLPMAQSMVRYLAGGIVEERNLKPGQPLMATFDNAAENRANLARPDGTSISVPLARRGHVQELRYTDTRHPGRYTVRVRVENQNRALHFVVRPPVEESDLTPVTSERLAEISSMLNLRLIDPEPSQLSAALDAARLGNELSALLLALVLVLGALESGMARAWTSESIDG